MSIFLMAIVGMILALEKYGFNPGDRICNTRPEAIQAAVPDYAYYFCKTGGSSQKIRYTGVRSCFCAFSMTGRIFIAPKAIDR
jgi:hypothetical protein